MFEVFDSIIKIEEKDTITYGIKNENFSIEDVSVEKEEAIELCDIFNGLVNFDKEAYNRVFLAYIAGLL